MLLGRDMVRIALHPPAHQADGAGGAETGWGAAVTVFAARSSVPAKVTLKSGILSDVETQLFTIWASSQVAAMRDNGHRWKLVHAGRDYAIRAVDIDETLPRARLVLVAERGEAVAV